MKTLILIFCSLFTSISFADVYVVVDKNTKAIITASEKNDTVMDGAQELIILQGDFETLNLQEHPTNYFYKNNKFIKNTEKIDAAEAKQQAEIQRKNKESQDKESAKAKLKALGLTDDEVAVLFKGD